MAEKNCSCGGKGHYKGTMRPVTDEERCGGWNLTNYSGDELVLILRLLRRVDRLEATVERLRMHVPRGGKG